METFQAIVDRLASPPWFFTLALAAFLACRRSPHPWTRAGGAALLAATLAFAGLALSDPGFRQRVLHPERLPVAVLCLSSLAVVWFEMRRVRRPGATGGAGETFRPPSPADALTATALGLVLVACALLVPAPLGAVADPAARPDLVKVPWFLTGLQELEHYFPPWVPYAAVPALLLAGLLGLPWLAEGETRAARPGRALFLFGWFFLWLWPMATGALLRGPGWIARGPFEAWEAASPPPAEPRALSELFWIHWLRTFEPSSWWLRELPGILLLAAYFVLLPAGLSRWRATRGVLAGYRELLGPWRFRIAGAWVLAILLLPLKMYGRWLLDVGPWIRLPELAFEL